MISKLVIGGTGDRDGTDGNAPVAKCLLFKCLSVLVCTRSEHHGVLCDQPCH